MRARFELDSVYMTPHTENFISVILNFTMNIITF